jgi:hypothetical protein
MSNDKAGYPYRLAATAGRDAVYKIPRPICDSDLFFIAFYSITAAVPAASPVTVSIRKSKREKTDECW